ncbi:MAG: TonB family protein [Myxococcota bacterium]
MTHALHARLVLVWCTIGALLVTSTAMAQTAPAPTSPPGAPVADATLEPPHAITATTVDLPPDAPAFEQPLSVSVKLVVGVDGLVKKVELVQSCGIEVLDQAVVRAAQGFQFVPARYQGKAVAVEITFRHTFLPPPPLAAPAADGGPPLTAVLRGKLVEKGTRAPVTGATVAAQVGDRHYTAEVDGRGRFRLPLPAGEARVTVHGSNYLPFLQVEKLVAGQELAIAYYVERDRYDPYEILVFGQQRRQEISRVTLRGAEIKQVPGTFGDPFRVIQTLPGVASIMALLPFPVVRGASPGSTGFLVDGTRVPLLYHLLAGPSVIHPEFIDEVQFYPGGSPVIYGGYTAGIIDGRTRRARSDESLTDIDINLLQTGALVRRPLPFMNATVTAAARVGYPGIIMSLATDEASLSYWDYQFRLDGGTPRKGYTVFAFGANDEVDAVSATADPNDTSPPLEPVLVLSFHRLDLRANWGSGRFDGLYRAVVGVDETVAGATSSVRMLVFEPSARWRFEWSRDLELVAGLEGSIHETTQSDSGTGGNSGMQLFTEDLSTFSMGTALTEAIWRPNADWMVRPGVRADLHYDGTTTQLGVDPRLTVRWRLTEQDLSGDATTTTASAKGKAQDDRGIWLKGAIGVYHQPPRFFLPLPGLDAMPLRFGLLQAIQSSAGVEMPFGKGLTLNLEGYYNDMDPVVFDLETNATSLVQTGPTSLPGTVPEDTSSQNGFEQALDRLVAAQVGRSYGLEVLARRQARNGLYGWLSYTLSLSERKRDAAWVPYDYDRTHLVNLVAGLPLPRNWDLGVRLQYQSGKPATTTFGYNTARTEGYFRVDVRVDKRAVWNKWLLDFYVDLTNVALFPEEVAPGSTIRYVLPTVGLRGRL